jgi:hypothetical protein
MEDKFPKIESQEDLLQKLADEIEVIESIFVDEGVILAKPEGIPVDELDVSTANSGNNASDQEDAPISQFLVQVEMDIKPNTGFDMAKVGMLIHCRLIFD